MTDTHTIPLKNLTLCERNVGKTGAEDDLGELMPRSKRMACTGELFHNMWVSFWRATIGFGIGGAIGFAFGLANGLSARSEAVFDSTQQMVRNVPHLALIPLVILWFGIDETAKIFLVALGVFFPTTSIPSTAFALSIRS